MVDERTLSLCRKARETGFFAVLGKEGARGVARLGALTITGADATSFLHSQLTNDVKNLKPGEGQYNARVTRTGTLVRWFSLHHLPLAYPGLTPGGLANNGYLLLIERDGIPALLSDLGKFAVVEDAALEDVSDMFDWLAIQGPNAGKLASSVFGDLEDGTWNIPENSTVFNGDVLVTARSLAGDTGYVIGLPRRDDRTIEATLQRVATAALDHDALLLKDSELNDVIDVLRIESGVVLTGVDTQENERVLPQTGLEQQVVSYSKGCYLGQEVIARIRTYGSLPWVLRGLVFDAPQDAASQNAILEKLPAIGADAILDNGTKVGTFASRAIAPMLNAAVAFAYLDRTTRTPGTVLKLRGSGDAVVSARVALLPFYKASDLKARVTFLHDRAVRFFADGHDDDALKMLEEALRLDPGFADGYEALGVILGRKQRFEEAIDIFKRLEEVAPNEPMVHTNLSLFYMKIGDKTKAEEEKAKATVKQFSRFGALHKEKAQADAEEQQRRADAQRKMKMFEEVLEIDPEDPIALFGLGNAYSTLGEWAQAEAMLARAAEAQKDNSPVYLARGKALEMLSRNEEALSVYKAGMAVASRKGDLMPLKEMERRVLLLTGASN